MIRALLVLAGLMSAATGHAAEAVLLHAAGSLSAALTEVAQAFETTGGAPVAATFGASGLLRDAIAGGAKAEVFASANMEHPQALAAAGQSGPVVLFARNRLCALARPGLDVTTETIVARMLDPAIKLGTSTPKADPSGDYAWEAFRKAEALRPGSFATLDAKALQLTGGPASPKPPPDRNLYGLIIERGDADLFLTYCTNARAARAEVRGATIIPLPETIAVGADYGLTVMNGASAAAFQLALLFSRARDSACSPRTASMRRTACTRGRSEAMGCWSLTSERSAPGLDPGVVRCSRGRQLPSDHGPALDRLDRRPRVVYGERRQS